MKKHIAFVLAITLSTLLACSDSVNNPLQNETGGPELAAVNKGITLKIVRKTKDGQAIVEYKYSQIWDGISAIESGVFYCFSRGMSHELLRDKVNKGRDKFIADLSSSKVKKDKGNTSSSLAADGWEAFAAFDRPEQTRLILDSYASDPYLGGEFGENCTSPLLDLIVGTTLYTYYEIYYDGAGHDTYFFIDSLLPPQHHEADIYSDYYDQNTWSWVTMAHDSDVWN